MNKNLFELIKELDATITKKFIAQFFSGQLKDKHIMFKNKGELEYKPLVNDNQLNFQEQEYMVVDGKPKWMPITEKMEQHRIAAQFFSVREQMLNEAIEKMYGEPNAKLH